MHHTNVPTEIHPSRKQKKVILLFQIKHSCSHEGWEYMTRLTHIYTKSKDGICKGQRHRPCFPDLLLDVLDRPAVLLLLGRHHAEAPGGVHGHGLRARLGGVLADQVLVLVAVRALLRDELLLLQAALPGKGAFQTGEQHGGHACMGSKKLNRNAKGFHNLASEASRMHQGRTYVLQARGLGISTLFLRP